MGIETIAVFGGDQFYSMYPRHISIEKNSRVLLSGYDSRHR